MSSSEPQAVSLTVVMPPGFSFENVQAMIAAKVESRCMFWQSASLTIQPPALLPVAQSMRATLPFVLTLLSRSVLKTPSLAGIQEPKIRQDCIPSCGAGTERLDGVGPSQSQAQDGGTML